MSDQTHIQLKTTCVLNIPLQIYSSDFLFIVNSKEFKTSKIISDLLSLKISRIHTNDPLFDQFTINTKHSGDFSKILKLVQFDILSISTNETEFVYEVLEILGNKYIEIINPTPTDTLTIENVLSHLKQHELFQRN